MNADPAAVLQRTIFLLGAVRSTQFPTDIGREVAIAGRSNGGKSSAINALTGIHGLARTSKLPGRTREINFFQINGKCRLVDLPGYGYARVPTPVKQTWQSLIEGYLAKRRSLKGVIIVMDCRHPLTAQDQQMFTWCQYKRLPIHVLLTKTDKLNRAAASHTLHQVQRQLAPLGISVQLFSALKREGIEKAQETLAIWMEMGKMEKKAPVDKREERPGPNVPGLGKPG